jgi:hypothetical protein
MLTSAGVLRFEFANQKFEKKTSKRDANAKPYMLK